MEFEQDILNCLGTLRKGGIILYPTDTIWGIGCDATNAEAVKKIIALKRRPPSKSMIVLLADPRDINKYTSSVNPAIADYIERAERPTTVIYDGALGLAENLVAQDGSIGIRVIKEDFCRHLIKRFRKPIVSTSANISEQSPPVNFDAISCEIIEGVDYVVKFRQNEIEAGRSSVLVKFNSNGEVVVLRS